MGLAAAGAPLSRCAALLLLLLLSAAAASASWPIGANWNGLVQRAADAPIG